MAWPAPVERVAASVEVGPARNQLPWPGGEGVLFDALEAGGSLDGGLTEPVTVELPDGDVFLRTGEVREGALHLVVLELAGE